VLLIQRELYDLEDRYKKAMMTNAHLDNEKQALKYEADRLRDQVDDMTEQTTELQRELRDKTRVCSHTTQSLLNIIGSVLKEMVLCKKLLC